MVQQPEFECKPRSSLSSSYETTKKAFSIRRNHGLVYKDGLEKFWVNDQESRDYEQKPWSIHQEPRNASWAIIEKVGITNKWRFNGNTLYDPKIDICKAIELRNMDVPLISNTIRDKNKVSENEEK